MAVRWRTLVVVAVVLATVSALPMLAAPWDEDEVFLVGAVQGTSPWMNSRFDAYRFSSGDEKEVARLVASGAMPWYTAPDFKYALYRPLTSALLWIDSLAFGDRRLGYQLDAMFWHALLVVAAAAVLARAAPGRAGQGALLLFATSVTHTTAVGWLSARHVLVAAVPGMFALAAHQRWREDGARWGAVVAPLGVGVSLLASEAGLQMVPYFVAYELCRREPLSRRARALAPVVAVTVLWFVVYKALGRGHDYGASFGDPVALLSRGVPRIVLHAAVLLGVSLRPDNGWGFYALRWTLVAAVPGFLLARAAIRRLDAPSRTGATWLALGAAGSLLPGVGVALESRVLVAASLGGAMVVATIIAAGVDELRGDRRPWLVGGSALLAAVHALAIVELPSHYGAMIRQRDQRLGAFLRASRGDRPDLDVLVVGGSPHFLFGQLGGYVRARTTGARVRRWVGVADANCAHTLERPAEDRVIITPRCREGYFPYGVLQRGDETKQAGWTVTVLEGHPHGRFELRGAGEGTELVGFRGFADVPITLAVGEGVALPEPVSFEEYGIDAPSRWMHTRFGP